MANLKDIQRQIKSVSNTQKTTRAMKLVSTAKLRRAEELAKRSRLYAQKMNQVIAEIAGRIDCNKIGGLSNRFFEKIENPKMVDIVFVTADKGLCGGFNIQTIKAVNKLLKEYKDKNVKVRLRGIGKKGIEFFKYNEVELFDTVVGLSSKPDKVKSDEFIKTISTAIDILKTKMKNALISLCMMDTGVRDVNSPKKCGYENCALGDKDEWNRSIPIFKALNYKLDFISFQEMIGQFSRNPLNPGTWNNPNPIAYTDEELGINYIGKRVDNLAKFLIENLKKPVFLAYTSIATATWKDLNKDGKIQDNEINPLGWLDEAKSGYSQIKNCKNIFGFSIMNLFDNPTHDNGGWQFFLQNEYHLGIITGKILDNQLTGNIKEKDHLLEIIFSK